MQDQYQLVSLAPTCPPNFRGKRHGDNGPPISPPTANHAQGEKGLEGLYVSVPRGSVSIGGRLIFRRQSTPAGGKCRRCGRGLGNSMEVSEGVTGFIDSIPHGDSGSHVHRTLLARKRCVSAHHRKRERGCALAVGICRFIVRQLSLELQMRARTLSEFSNGCYSSSLGRIVLRHCDRRKRYQ